MLVAGEDAFQAIDVRVSVKGGGHTSQVYAIRQAIAKAVVAYYAKYLDAYSAMELKKKLVAYDRTLLIADPRRAEPKKFGGHGARARRQKRCVLQILNVSYNLTICQLPVKGCLLSTLGVLHPVILLFIRYAMATCCLYGCTLAFSCDMPSRTRKTDDTCR